MKVWRLVDSKTGVELKIGDPLPSPHLGVAYKVHRLETNQHRGIPGANVYVVRADSREATPAPQGLDPILLGAAYQ